MVAGADQRRRNEVHLRRADEAGDEQVGRLVEDVVRRRRLLDDAAAHHRDAVGHGQRLELVVGDDDRRLVEAGQDLLDLAAHGLAQLHVEAAQRLVEEKAGRIADDGAADRDTLLLALGELAGQAVEDVAELQGVADPLHPLGELGRRQAIGMQRIGEVLRHRLGGIEGIELEDHGDVAVAGLEVVDPPAGDQHVAAGRRLEPGDHPQGRGLAAARGAEQADDLAGPDREVHVVDRHQPVEALGQRAQLDGRHGVRLSA